MVLHRGHDRLCLGLPAAEVIFLLRFRLDAFTALVAVTALLRILELDGGAAVVVVALLSCLIFDAHVERRLTFLIENE